MSLWAKDVEGNVQVLAHLPHDPQALLIVGTSTSNKDLDLELFQLDLKLLQGSDDAFERGGHVGEVGNASTNDQDLATRIHLPGHEGEEGLGVVVGLLLTWSSGVFSIVGQFFGSTCTGYQSV